MDSVVDFFVEHSLANIKENLPEIVAELASKLTPIVKASVAELTERLSSISQRILSQLLNRTSGSSDATADTDYLSIIFSSHRINRITTNVGFLTFFFYMECGKMGNKGTPQYPGDSRMEHTLRLCHQDLICDLHLQNTENQSFLKDLIHHPSKIMDQMEANSIIEKTTERERNEEFVRWINGKLSLEQFQQTLIPLLGNYNPHLAATLNTAAAESTKLETTHVCLGCRVKGSVQPKKLAKYLYEKRAISQNLYEDLRNPNSTNATKWKVLEEQLADGGVPSLIAAMEESYPHLHEELIESQLHSMECLCSVSKGSKSQYDDKFAQDLQQPIGHSERDRIEFALHACMGDLAPNLDLRGTTIIDTLCQDGKMNDQEVASVIQKPSTRERYEEFVRIVSVRYTLDDFIEEIIPRIRNEYPGVATKIRNSLNEWVENVGQRNKCTICRLQETVEIKRVSLHLRSIGAITPTLYQDLLNPSVTNTEKWNQLKKSMKGIRIKDLIDALEWPYPKLYEEFKNVQVNTFVCMCDLHSDGHPQRKEKDEEKTPPPIDKMAERRRVAAILNRCQSNFIQLLDLKRTDLLGLIVNNSSLMTKMEHDHIVSITPTPKQNMAFLEHVKKRFKVHELSHVLCKYLHESQSNISIELQRAILDEMNDEGSNKIPDEDNTLPISCKHPVVHPQQCWGESTVSFKPAEEESSYKEMFRKGLVKFTEGDYMAIWTNVEVGENAYYTLPYDPLAANSSAKKFDLGTNHKNISLTNVETTDFYRPGKPYRLLRSHTATIKFRFKLSSEKKSTLLCLHHCRTTSDAFINVRINGARFLHNFGCAPRENFQYQIFYIPGEKLASGVNVIEFKLNEKSKAVYWLSEISILLVRNIPPINTLTPLSDTELRE